MHILRCLDEPLMHKNLTNAKKIKKNKKSKKDDAPITVNTTRSARCSTSLFAGEHNIGQDVGWANENEVGPDEPRARKIDLRMDLSNSEFGGVRGIQM